MNRFPKLTLILALATLARAKELPVRTNIVFIISDDQAWSDYDSMGHPDLPNKTVNPQTARSDPKYAHKIAGATHLALFRVNQNPAAQAQAVSELEKSLVAWRELSTNARQRYLNPVWLKRVGSVDWEEAIIDLENDIAIAREGRPAPSIETSTEKNK